MYKIDFPLDAKQAAAIDRRRRIEEERKLRIFNPKERIIGKDCAALERQISEKREREQKERELNEAWVRETNRQQLLSKELQRRTEEDRRKAWLEVQEFRKTCQRFEDRREFDINDPRKCRYAARLHDEDVRCGPASMQKFEGEDLTSKARVSNQQLQKKAWLDAQIAEKRQNQREFEEATKMYEQTMRERFLRSYALTKAEEDARKAVDLATKEYNRALAQENAEKRKLQQLADEEATLAHQLNMFHSELLSEVTDATSVNGPLRVGKDRFKGFTPEMNRTYKEEQLRQIEERKRREEEEKQYDNLWNQMHRRYSLATRVMDMETEKRLKDNRLDLTSTNMELAREQRLRKEYLNNSVFKGGFTDEFFEQFNTTTR